MTILKIDILSGIMNSIKVKKILFTTLLITVTTIGMAHSHHYGAKGSNDESTIEDAIKEFTEIKGKESKEKQIVKYLRLPKL